MISCILKPAFSTVYFTASIVIPSTYTVKTLSFSAVFTSQLVNSAKPSKKGLTFVVQPPHLILVLNYLVSIFLLIMIKNFVK